MDNSGDLARLTSRQCKGGKTQYSKRHLPATNLHRKVAQSGKLSKVGLRRYGGSKVYAHWVAVPEPDLSRSEFAGDRSARSAAAVVVRAGAAFASSSVWRSHSPAST